MSICSRDARRSAGAWVLAAALLCAGCRGPSLNAARWNFYAGRLERAESDLSSSGTGGRDAVLHYMERGMIRHARGDYEGSVRDWLAAVQLQERLETHSASKAAASMVVNDTLLDFRGYPFERVLLHTFLAQNFMMMERWDEAAVEGRNIVRRLGRMDGFPDDPFSRYVAGFSFEMIGDGENAAVQYRLVSQLLKTICVEADTGRLAQPDPMTTAGGEGRPSHELVCFFGLGRMLSGSAWEEPPRVEIHTRGARLGAGWVLAHTTRLMAESESRMAARRFSKTVARIAVKESIASALERENEAVGALARLILFSMETPDLRCWETLPKWMGVARVPCPADLTSFELRVSNGRTITVSSRIARRDRTFVAVCRDYATRP